MATEAAPSEEEPKKGSKLPLIIGLVLALAGGGGGFFAVQSTGAVDEVSKDVTQEPIYGDAEEVAFVALDPLVISIQGNNGRDHLRFSAQLEVAPEYAAEVETMKPRIVDVLNGYLRAVRVEDIEEPTALLQIRSHMMRRIDIVVGDGKVHDLLIMEFVLS